MFNVKTKENQFRKLVNTLDRDFLCKNQLRKAGWRILLFYQILCKWESPSYNCYSYGSGVSASQKCYANQKTLNRMTWIYIDFESLNLNHWLLSCPWETHWKLACYKQLWLDSLFGYRMAIADVAGSIPIKWYCSSILTCILCGPEIPNVIVVCPKKSWFFSIWSIKSLEVLAERWLWFFCRQKQSLWILLKYSVKLIWNYSWSFLFYFYYSEYISVWISLFIEASTVQFPHYSVAVDQWTISISKLVNFFTTKNVLNK